MKKLLLVEDSEIIRDRLVALLGVFSGVSSLATAATLDEARTLTRALQPDLIVLDLSLPDGNALFQIPAFLSLAPQTQIAVLTNDVSAAVRSSCLRMGARWHFDKSREFEDLISLVHHVVEGQTGAATETSQ